MKGRRALQGTAAAAMALPPRSASTSSFSLPPAPLATLFISAHDAPHTDIVFSIHVTVGGSLQMAAGPRTYGPHSACSFRV